MNAIPLFSAEISLYEDIDSGLRIECSARLVRTLQECLTARGFNCSQPEIVITGTRKIHDWDEFTVSGGAFPVMRQVVRECLERLGANLQEEVFTSIDGQHVRLNLTNISVFDK